MGLYDSEERKVWLATGDQEAQERLESMLGFSEMEIRRSKEYGIIWQE